MQRNHLVRAGYVVLLGIAFALGGWAQADDAPCSTFCRTGDIIMMTRQEAQKIEALLVAAHLAIEQRDALLALCRAQTGTCS